MRVSLTNFFVIFEILFCFSIAQRIDFEPSKFERGVLEIEDALGTYTDLTRADIAFMLSKQFNYTNFLANHIIDGFFVNFQEKWQMKMVLKKSSNNKKVKHFTGKGFDANGEHFDVTKGSILESGHWTFVKSYNGRGPQGWTHEWRYAGEMNGKIWYGGFQKVEKAFDEMFIAQTFFYENSTVFDYPERVHLHKLSATTVPKPFSLCKSKTTQYSENILNAVRTEREKRRVANWSKKLTGILENAMNGVNSNGIHVDALSSVRKGMANRVGANTDDLTRVCFRRMIQHRFKKKGNGGKHLIARARRLMKLLCSKRNSKEESECTRL
ncbi:unnamed protein product [Oikopleura dioica]|uniref:Uncharacterized protein n=1 Tax=Oikopleura dioica TaxID=34765 RepID=E4YT47_OIKDI|nr:unnamed protein product [Oikopleura dioica]